MKYYTKSFVQILKSHFSSDLLGLIMNILCHLHIKYFLCHYVLVPRLSTDLANLLHVRLSLEMFMSPTSR